MSRRVLGAMRRRVVLAGRCGAGRQTAPPGSNLTTGCVESFDAAADYFPDKAAIEDAVNFTVEYRRSYKVVTVKEAYAGGPPERYVLVQCGAPAPSAARASWPARRS